MVNDSISDMLTRIRNASIAKKATVFIPYTRMNQQIAQILEKEGFIQAFQISSDARSLLLRLKELANLVFEYMLIIKKFLVF